MRINPTCTIFGCGGPNPLRIYGQIFPPGLAAFTATNDLFVLPTGNNIVLQLAASNGASAPLGAWLLGEINSLFVIKPEPFGNLKASFAVKAFPSIEAYQITNGTASYPYPPARALLQRREQGWNPASAIDSSPDPSSLNHSEKTTYTVCTNRSYCN
jgi:hypothetical protein